MDKHKIESALMRHLFETMPVRPYGDGFLVGTPLTYSDGDTVTVAVFPLNDAFKVTDRAEALDRLDEAGVAVGKQNRTGELIALLRRQARLAPINAHEAEIADLVTAEQIGPGVLRVAELAQRIEHLRWSLREAAPVPYRDVVISEATSLSKRHGWRVKPNAVVKLNEGQERRFTATVDVGHRRGFIQALSLTEKNTAVEHAYYMFSNLDADPKAKLAVFDTRRGPWPEAELSTIERQGTVVLYKQPRDLERALLALA